MRDIQPPKETGLKMENNRYLIICSNINQDIVSSLKNETTPEDKLIVSVIPKYPTRFFEKMFFEVRGKFDWMVLVNNNSRFISNDFLTMIKKHKVYDGLVFRGTDDLQSDYGVEILSNKLILDDDSLCIPMKLFKGFRDIVPMTIFSGIIKQLSKYYMTYADVSRNLVGYNDIMKEKRILSEDEARQKANEMLLGSNKVYENDIIKRKKVIEIFWQEEVKKKKQREEMLMRTIPRAVKKINKNGTTSIVSKRQDIDVKQDVNVGEWNNWMMNEK